MDKKILFLTGYLILQFALHAQNPAILNFKGQTSYIPPSPNSSALAKYAEIPVNLHTGIPQIGSPLFSWKSKRGNSGLNVGLSYHAGGIKVEDIAPNTGLGWSLNASGVVTRSVRGLPDDDARGFINTPVIEDAYNTGSYDGGYYLNPVALADEYVNMDTSRYKILAHYNSDAQTIFNLQTGFWDTEQDMFYYNFTGGSGKFVLDKDGTVNKIDQNDLEIAVQYTLVGVHQTKKIVSFTIQNDDGILYLFDLPEESNSQSSTTIKQYNYSNGGGVSFSFPGGDTRSMSSTYHLTKVRDKNSADSIQFIYTDRDIKYINGYNESVEYHEGDDPAQTGVQTYSKRAQETSSIQFNGTRTKQISSILLPDKKTVRFYYDLKREDIQGDSALTRIEVTDGFGNSKKYRLRYSYFDATNIPANPNNAVGNWLYTPGSISTGVGILEMKPEYFNLRLRLDKIDIVADWNNSDSILVSAYVYNDTVLPPRNSKAIDYWGYYYGPDRFVNTTVPEIAPTIPMDLSKEGVIASSLDESRLNDYTFGSNRVPDPLYARASTLQQIKMPTGGSTILQMETNTVKGPVYHYSNREHTIVNTIIRKKAAALPDQLFLMPCRSLESVLFYAKIKRVNADGSPYISSSIPQQAICFENAVGDSKINFTVQSTDGSIVKEVQISAVEEGEADLYPVHFLLPAGKEYTLSYTYDRQQAPCLEDAFFDISTRIVYTTDKNIDYAGGLRVASISHYDPLTSQTMRTLYNYDGDNGGGEGSCNPTYPSTVLPAIPNFTTSSVRGMGKWTEGTDGWPVFLGYATYKSRSSNSNQTLGYSGGSNVGYTKVSISKVNSLNQPLGKTVSYFSGIAIKNEHSVFPFKTNQVIDWNSGQLLKEQVYDNANKLLKQTDYSYYTGVSPYDNHKNKSIRIASIRSDNKAQETHAEIYHDRYVASSFYPYYGKSLLIKKKETDYVNTESMVTETRYIYYNSTSHIQYVTSYNSKGEKVVTQYTYPQDYTNAAIRQLVANKVTGTPIGSKTILPAVPVIGGTNADREVSGSGTDYEIQNGIVRPRAFYQLATDNPLTITPFDPAQAKQANDVLVGEVTRYDAYGNACEFKGRDGVIQTIIWGYNYTLPIAKISGIGYTAALAQLTSMNIDNLQQVTDDVTLRNKINEIRQANLSNPLVTVSTITYKPLIGVTSETDINGRTVYYEYDAFHRLRIVRDKDQNIIKRYDYKYQASPNY